METRINSLVDGRSFEITKSLLAKSYADKQTQHAAQFSSIILSSKANPVPIRRFINRYKQKYIVTRHQPKQSRNPWKWATNWPAKRNGCHQMQARRLAVQLTQEISFFNYFIGFISVL